MGKKILAALLAAVMVFMLLPATAFATDEEFIDGGIKYKVTADPSSTTLGKVEVIANSYTGTSYAIPSIAEDENGRIYTVTQIGSRAFYQCENLSGITATSVTSIGNDAFQKCTSLDTADFPAVTSIGTWVFYECTSLTTADFPAAISIGARAFSKCTFLDTASFPAATSISNNAFNGCTSLTTVSFPAATSISDNAFNGCTSLTTVSFPAAISIDHNAFNGCSSLTTADFPAATSIGTSAFVDCTLLTTVSFPKVTSIGASAFNTCTALEAASFPQVTDILLGAFNVCTALASLSLPAAPPTVEHGIIAFVGCPPVRSLTLVNANGAALTGQALNNAIDAYKAVDDGNKTDNLWYGWSLPARAVAPTINNHPAAQSATVGNPATFTVAATGTAPLSYQWQYRASASRTWANVTGGSGATSASYTTDATSTSMNGYQYRCVVSNGVLPNAESNPATLTVTVPTPPITITPAATIAQGGAPGNLRLNIGNPGSAPNTAAHFSSLEISPDGTSFTTVDAANYTLSYGSIHIALHQNWLNTLAPGAYTLRVNLAGAYAGIQLTTRLIVTIPGGIPGDGDADVPKAGDGSMPGLWLGIMLMAAGGLAASVVLGRRKRHEN